MELDRRYNIVKRAGLHCAPLDHETAGTIKQGALRFSLIIFKLSQNIETLLATLEEAIGG